MAAAKIRRFEDRDMTNDPTTFEICEDCGDELMPEDWEGFPWLCSCWLGDGEDDDDNS